MSETEPTAALLGVRILAGDPATPTVTLAASTPCAVAWAPCRLEALDLDAVLVPRIAIRSQTWSSLGGGARCRAPT